MLIGDRILARLNTRFPLIVQSRKFNSNAEASEFSSIMRAINQAQNLKFDGYQSARHYFDEQLDKGFTILGKQKRGCIYRDTLSNSTGDKITIPKNLIPYVTIAVKFISE